MKTENQIRKKLDRIEDNFEIGLHDEETTEKEMVEFEIQMDILDWVLGNPIR